MWWDVVQVILNDRELSSRWLAKAADIPETTLENYRNGTIPGFDKACKIADALGVSLDDLRGDQDGAEPEKRNSAFLC